MKNHHSPISVPIPPGGPSVGTARNGSPIREDADRPKEKSEESEVRGRHKNSGQKDHKGAR